MAAHDACLMDTALMAKQWDRSVLGGHTICLHARMCSRLPLAGCSMVLRSNLVDGTLTHA